MVRQVASSFVVTVVTSVALLGAGGCSKKKEAEKGEPSPKVQPAAPATAKAPTPAEPSAPAPAPARTVGVKADIGGKVLDLNFGVVRDPVGRGTQFLVLGTEKGDCDKDPGAYVEIALPAGRGGTFSAGKPFAVPIRTSSLGIDADDVPSYLVTVTLDPVQRKKGARVTGTIEAEMIKDGKRTRIAGAFDAEMCDEFEGYEAPPATVADGPVTGVVKGEKFEGKSAIVYLVHDEENKVSYLSELMFYVQPGITCANKAEQASGVPYLRFGDLGGADSKHNLIGGTASPDGSLFFSNEKQENVMGQTWIRFDSLELKTGGVLKGSLYNREGSDSQLAGSFAAEICE